MCLPPLIDEEFRKDDIRAFLSSNLKQTKNPDAMNGDVTFSIHMDDPIDKNKMADSRRKEELRASNDGKVIRQTKRINGQTVTYTTGVDSSMVQA